MQLTVHGEIVDRLPTQRITALVAYLALHPDWQPRERVAEAVWPNLPEGKALVNLRTALSMLRRILEPSGVRADSALESTRTHVRLLRNRCECDVWEIEADPSSAGDLYQGDLVPELYDDWLTPFRDRMRVAFLGTIGADSKRSFEAGNMHATAELAARWLEADPFEPEAVRILALARSRTGNKKAATQLLDRFVQGYQAELGHLPELDVASLKSQIESAEPMSPDPTETPQAAMAERVKGLPLYLTRYFGREAEMDEIQTWIAGPERLLTVTGMGGMGKTRLVVEAARQAPSKLKYLSLVGADSGDGMIASLLALLELRESESEPPIEVLKANPPSGLLVLDNLEQIAAEAGPIVMELLGAWDDMSILCTSRELLGIEGERIISLAPLGASDNAVQMFVDRARNSRADFALTQRNSEDVAALCQELEGLPLAIELMAAWAGTWSVSEMRRNAFDRTVVARKRGHDPRHASLQASIEWSFDLLDAETKRFLNRLSLFRGGWTLEAAEEVTGIKDSRELLARLVDRSLVYSAEVETGLRFSMLESVRVYCRAQLSDGEARKTAPRFLAHFARIAKEFTNACAGAEERLNHCRLDLERENIDAAVALCEQGLASADSGLQLAGTLHLHWVYRGQGSVGIALLDRLLALPIDEPSGWGRILGYQTLSVLSQDRGDIVRSEEAIRSLQKAAEGQKDWEIRFRVLTQVGNFFNRYGRFEEGVEPHSQAIQIAIEAGDARMQAVGECNLAEALFGLGRYEDALDRWSKAAELDRLSGNLAGEATLFLGFAKTQLGDPQGGAKYLKTYLATVIALEFRRGYGRAVHFIALSAVVQGDRELARTLAASAVNFLEQESLVYDAFESKCAELVDREVGSTEGALTVEIEEAIRLANSFLDGFPS